MIKEFFRYDLDLKIGMLIMVVLTILMIVFSSSNAACAQVIIQSPPNIMDSNQVSVYSWERPSTSPRYQQPRTGIFMQSGSTPPPVFEEVEE